MTRVLCKGLMREPEGKGFGSCCCLVLGSSEGTLELGAYITTKLGGRRRHRQRFQSLLPRERGNAQSPSSLRQNTAILGILAKVYFV